jgi:hypothetical protein
MRNKMILTIAAVAALGTATMATSALAFPHGGGGRGVGGGGMASMGSMKSGAMGIGQRNIGQSFAPMHSNVTGPNVAVNAAPKFGGPNAGTNWNHNGQGHGRYANRGDGYGYGGLYAFAPGYDDYSYDSSWYQWRWVPTPFGLRWRDVWVCD